MVRIRRWQLKLKRTTMLAWRDLAVFYANNKRYETLKIRPLKCTMSEDLVEKEKMPQLSPCALTIIGLEIPQFTTLGLKDSLDIGGLHKRTSLIKPWNY